MATAIAIDANRIESRLFWITAALSMAGGLLVWALFGARQGLSFVAGAGLAGIDLIWLRSTVKSIFFNDPKRSKVKILTGFFLRLLLIPLCLYVMIRFLFLGILAAVAGFAIFVCSVLIEGILEAFAGSRR
jgi:hypothetical protein